MSIYPKSIEEMDQALKVLDRLLKVLVVPTLISGFSVVFFFQESSFAKGLTMVLFFSAINVSAVRAGLLARKCWLEDKDDQSRLTTKLFYPFFYGSYSVCVFVATGLFIRSIF